MRRLLIICAVLLLFGCVPRMSSYERAYRDGRLTEYQYQKLKFMEAQTREVERANMLRVLWSD